MYKYNDVNYQDLPRIPQPGLGKFLCVAAFGAWLFGCWGLLPLFLLAVGLHDFDRAGAGLVALFLALQSRKDWVSILGGVGLKVVIATLVIAVAVYLSGMW